MGAVARIRGISFCVASPIPRSRFKMSGLRSDLEALFTEHLSLIGELAAIACRKFGIHGADAEDAAAWVRKKLIEDDYAVLRAYPGNVGVQPYLASIIARHLISYVRQVTGRVRHSTAGERSGAPAQDAYTMRDGIEAPRRAGIATSSEAPPGRLSEENPLCSELTLPEHAALGPDGLLSEDDLAKWMLQVAQEADGEVFARAAVMLAESGDALLKEMQTPQERAAARRAFDASPDELRTAAVEAARGGGR